MTDHDLHDALAEIATDVRSVDLYERSLRRSRQLSRRRTALAMAATGLAVVLVTVFMTQVAMRPSANPVQPASPSSARPAPAPTGRDANDVKLELDSATLDFPAWPRNADSGDCPAGAVTLVDGIAQVDATHAIVLRAALRSMFGGKPLIIVSAGCVGPTDTGLPSEQIVAFRPVGNAYTLVAPVVQTDQEAHEFGAITFPATDRLAVQVLHRASTEGTSVFLQSQTWVYGWNGSAFRPESTGPFTTDSPRYPVDAVPRHLVFGPPTDGCRHGELSVRVTNSGPDPLAELWVVLTVAEPAPLQDCDFANGQSYEGSTVAPVGALSVGDSRTITIAITVHDAPNLPPQVNDGRNYVQLQAVDQDWPTKYPIVTEYL